MVNKLISLSAIRNIDDILFAGLGEIRICFCKYKYDYKYGVFIFTFDKILNDVIAYDHHMWNI